MKRPPDRQPVRGPDQPLPAHSRAPSKRWS